METRETLPCGAVALAYDSPIHAGLEIHGRESVLACDSTPAFVVGRASRKNYNPGAGWLIVMSTSATPIFAERAHDSRWSWHICKETHT